MYLYQYIRECLRSLFRSRLGKTDVFLTLFSLYFVKVDSLVHVPYNVDNTTICKNQQNILPDEHFLNIHHLKSSSTPLLRVVGERLFFTIHTTVAGSLVAPCCIQHKPCFTKPSGSLRHSMGIEATDGELALPQAVDFHTGNPATFPQTWNDFILLTGQVTYSLLVDNTRV